MKPYPYTRAYSDRHGRLRVEYRRHGRTIPLKGEMGTAELQAAYDAAKAWMAVGGSQPSPMLERVKADTLRWLSVQWFKSAEFGELGEDTRKEHRRRLEEMMREPSSPSTPQFRFGDYPVAKLETKHIKVLRDRKADAPTAANHRLNTLRLLFNWAIDNDNKGGLTHNPGLPLHKLKTSTEGHHTWTDEEREQFKRRWAVGTMARLAYELFFTTGQRLGDVYKFGPHTIQNGTLCFTQEKNGRHNPVPMVLPVPADLQAALNATKTGQATFITKDKAGNPFSSKKSLGTWFKACCAKAELPHCCAHGLRKSSATSHADNGASANELMAIHGWKSLRSAEGYVRKANQKKLAAQAMARV